MAPTAIGVRHPFSAPDPPHGVEAHTWSANMFHVAGLAVAMAAVMLAVLRQRRQREEPHHAGEGMPDEAHATDKNGDSPSEQAPLAGAPSSGDNSSLWRRLSRPSWDTLVVGGLLVAAAIVTQADVMWNSLMAAKQTSANSITGYRCTQLSSAGRLRHYGTLEGFSHLIHTRVRHAQRHFDQGMMNLFSYNQREALQSFKLCVEEDPLCAMCHWGIAYAHGPFVNKVEHSKDAHFGPMYYPAYGPTSHAEAHAATVAAANLSSAAVSADPESDIALRDLQYIEALQIRFHADAVPGKGYRAAELKYAVAMEKVGGGMTETVDADALALAAEALVNTEAWDYYQDHTKNGTLREASARAVLLLEAVLRIQPAHPLALHLVIHLKEQLPAGSGPGTASEGEETADRLTVAQPGMGHLLHMPSHLFLRVGRYIDGVRSSVLAVKRDYLDSMACLAPYAPDHNIDMLLWHASMTGEYATGMEYAQLQRRYGRGDMNPLSKYPGTQWTNMLLFQTRFAKWSDVLHAQAPSEGHRGNSPFLGKEFAVAMWHFGRFLGLAAEISDSNGVLLKSITNSSEPFKAALAEAEAFKNTSQLADDSLFVTLPGSTARSGRQLGLYSGGYKDLVEHAGFLVDGRLAALDGDWDEAIRQLQWGAALEDNMEYMEPPRFMQPTRQCLGKVLLDARRYPEAEQCFRKDLEVFPENAWSLLGLSRSLAGQGNEREAAQAYIRHTKAWQKADSSLEKMRSSCPAFAGRFRISSKGSRQP